MSTADVPMELGDRLTAMGRRLDLARGEVLFQQRDEGRAIFWISRGRLRLERHLADGRAVTLSVARAPAVLAEASLFAERYHCRAVAEIASTVSVVPKTVVLDLLDSDPSFALSLVRALAAEVRNLRQLLELRNVRPASERLLAYLALAEERGRPAADRPLAALAVELGFTPEALYRIVARLQRQGVIHREGRKVTLARSKRT